MAFTFLPTVTSTSSNTATNPWAPAQPALKQTISGALDAYNNTYQGPQVAEMDPNVTAGQNAQLGIANRGLMTGAAQSGISGIQDILNSGGIGQQGQQALGYLNPYASGSYLNNNPYLDAIIGKSQQEAADRVNANFSSAGRYGSGAYAGTLGKELAGIGTNARYQDYLQQQANQLNAIGQMSNIGQQGINNIYNSGGALNNLQTPLYSDAQAQKGVGGERMDYRQAQIDAANQAPWARVGNLAQIAQGIGSMGGTSKTNSTSLGISPQQYTPTPSAGQIALGAGMSALGIGSNMATGAGGFKGLFGSAGSLMGSPFPTGGAGWYSDARLKRNINRIGYADNGLPIYAFDYKFGGPRHIGFMAQDVIQHNPDAVSVDPNSGYMVVDYGKAAGN